MNFSGDTMFQSSTDVDQKPEGLAFKLTAYTEKLRHASLCLSPYLWSCLSPYLSFGQPAGFMRTPPTESHHRSGPLSIISCWLPSATGVLSLSDSSSGSRFICRGHGVLQSVLLSLRVWKASRGTWQRGSWLLIFLRKATSCQSRLAWRLRADNARRL